MGLLLFKRPDGLKTEPDRVAFVRPLPIGPPTHHLPVGCVEYNQKCCRYRLSKQPARMRYSIAYDRKVMFL
jgi:hypothetical protein